MKNALIEKELDLETLSNKTDVENINNNIGENINDNTSDNINDNDSDNINDIDSETKKEMQEEIQNKTTNSNFILVEDDTKSNLQNNTNKKNIKSLTFWISLICAFIVVVQLVLNYFSIQFETKMIVEIISFVLAFLVSVGVLNSSLKTKDITEIKEDIKSDISSKIKSFSNKKDKTDTKTK